VGNSVLLLRSAPLARVSKDGRESLCCPPFETPASQAPQDED
jgi:hypothetical protein